MSDFGYGQLSYDDAASDLNAIIAAARTLIEQIDTHKLVQVVAVHPGNGTPPAAGTVDVQLLVSQIDGEGFPIPHGVVYGLPYYRMQGGPWAVICDPVKNDFGYVACLDRDSSAVIKNPGIQTPQSSRRYNVADGIYVGGVINAAPTAWIWLKGDGTFVISDQNQNGVQSTSNSLEFLIGGAALGTLNSSTMTFTVPVSAPDFEIPTTLPSYKNHTHNITVPSTPFGPAPTTAPNSGT